MKRKIIAVTGARSEYDLLYSVYKKLDHDKDIDFSLLVTGAHLSEKFGNTIDQIKEDNFKICAEVYNLIDSDKPIGRVLSLGNQISNLAHVFNNEKPDIVLIAGDREEAISVTLTAAYMNIPVAHFFGGDIAKDGNIDNAVRYAASKFAHIHFPTIEQHKETLLKLGEDNWRIHVVGNPSLDKFKEINFINSNAISEKFNFPVENKNYLVLIQHPIINEIELQKEHITRTLEAVLKSNCKCFINYPNSDAGNLAIITTINEYEAKYPEVFKTFKNSDRVTYLSLLKNALALLGNSSSGIVEVASLGIPAINIGKRQRGRFAGKNVIFVDNDIDEIYDSIHFIKTNKEFIHEVEKCINPYGDGNSGDAIVEILKNIKLDDNLIYKNITY